MPQCHVSSQRFRVRQPDRRAPGSIDVPSHRCRSPTERLRKFDMTTLRTWAALGVAFLGFVTARAGELPWVRVSADGTGFVRTPGDRPFVPWGVNYDHDSKGRL